VYEVMADSRDWLGRKLTRSGKATVPAHGHARG
jgi:hypothetical protein